MDRARKGLPAELRIALFGNRGTGKSSSANTILGRDWFRVNSFPRAVTQTSERKIAEMDGKKVLIIDTPGLFDSCLSEEHLQDQMENCACMSDPGLHAFLLVVRLDVGFSEKERNIMKYIQRTFGKDASHYAIVLLTHADHLNNEPLDEFIMESKDLQTLIKSCEGRFHAFNNQDSGDRHQVTELLRKIEQMMAKNIEHHPTTENFNMSKRFRTVMRSGFFAGVLGATFGLGALTVMVIQRL